MELSGVVQDINDVQSCNPRFLFQILPENIGHTKMTLPNPFLKKFGNRITDVVKLKFPNGDVFECFYDRNDWSLCGIVRVLHRYEVETYSFLSFKYVNNSCFSVTVIGTACIEIEYPWCGEYFPYDPKSKPSAIVLYGGHDVQNNVNRSLVEINGKCGSEARIEFCVDGEELQLISSQGVSENWMSVPCSCWSNGCGVYLCIGDKIFEVLVEKVGNKLFFKEGWKELKTFIGLVGGDVVMLSEDGNPFHFQVAVLKSYNMGGNTIKYGGSSSLEFVRYVNIDLIEYGELCIPRVFWEKSLTNLPGRVVLNVRSGLKYEVSHRMDVHKLIGLKKFVDDSSLKECKYILMSYIGDGEFYVTGYNKKYVEIDLL